MDNHGLPFPLSEIRKHFGEFLDKIDEQAPNCSKLAYPKSYQVPEGYSHPRVYIGSAFAATLAINRDQMLVQQDPTMASCYATSCKLIRYQVPTYFVSHELCEALLETEAPEDLMLSEIMWPMPAMLFMLPLDFTMAYFGRETPYVTVAHIDGNEKLQSPVMIDGQKARSLELHFPNDLFITTLMAWEEGFPTHYDARSPVNHSVKELLCAPLSKVELGDLPCKTTPEEDARTVARLTNITVNILLAMTAEPELITPESIVRPAKKINGKILRRALWRPKMIGENFRIEYESRDPKGTHRSPHAHWRCGHWRNQRHGPENKLVKRIWIKPVFVGLKTERDLA